LRVTQVQMSETARRFIQEAASGEIRIIANEPNERDQREYVEKEREERAHHHIPASDPVLFLEVTVRDPSEFESVLRVTGEERYSYRILRAESSAVANSIAALLRYLIFGDGEVAPVTREVLRHAEPDPQRRPAVHVA
jgi:hypothetical protein